MKDSSFLRLFYILDGLASLKTQPKTMFLTYNYTHIYIWIVILLNVFRLLTKFNNQNYK